MLNKLGKLLFVFMAVMIFNQVEVEASEQVIVPVQDFVPVYTYFDGDYVEMGQMRAGEPLIITGSEGDKWWKIKLGNASGYVEKNRVQVRDNVKVPAKNTKPNTNTTILIEKNTDIYDNSSGKLEKFALLKENYRYPILADDGNWWKIDFGGRTGFIHKNNAIVDTGVQVLMYHHMLTEAEKIDSPFKDRGTTITDTQFEEQMDYLLEYGYQTITSKDLDDYLDHRINLPAKVVLLTLDDGNISSRIYAYPILKERGLTADQFIITSRMPKKPATFDHKKLRFLSQQEIDEMHDVFYFHGHTHALHSLTSENKGYMITKNDAEVQEDLRLNREILDGTPYFAYPFGHYHEAAIQNLKDTGFRLAYTTKGGRVTLGTDKLLVPRRGVAPYLPIKDYGKLIGTGSKVLDAPVKPEEKPDLLYRDVLPGDYFYEDVINLSERNIIQGFPDGTFRPHRNVTRGQAAKILALSLNLDVENVTNPNFSDIDVTNEYYGPIAALVEKGIISGYPDGTFKETNPLSRGHMSKMLVLGFDLMDEEIQTDSVFDRFTDIPKDSEYAPYIQVLLTNEITTGTTPTTFSPLDTVKRRQLAAFIHRAEKSLE